MQGAYHSGTVDSADVFGPIWAGKPHSPFARVMPCHTQSDTTTRNHTTAIPRIQEGPGLEAISGIPMPCHYHAMPRPSSPLASSAICRLTYHNSAYLAP